MATFEDILKVNEGMPTVSIKGKDYVVVPHRVKAFRQLYPEGFILTDIISNENGIVVMQAKAGYYDKGGNPVVLGSGLAFEKQDSTYINKTSYIENCETSAIGRALGFLGLGIDSSICSAEELINAVNNQGNEDRPVRPQNAPNNATVTKGDALPKENGQAAKKAPVQPETAGAFLKRRIAEMAKEYEPWGFNFMEVRTALVKGGVVPDVPSATMSMEQAKQLVDAVDKFYDDRRMAS